MRACKVGSGSNSQYSLGGTICGYPHEATRTWSVPRAPSYSDESFMKTFACWMRVYWACYHFFYVHIHCLGETIRAIQPTSLLSICWSAFRSSEGIRYTSYLRQLLLIVSHRFTQIGTIKRVDLGILVDLSKCSRNVAASWVMPCLPSLFLCMLKIFSCWRLSLPKDIWRMGLISQWSLSKRHVLTCGLSNFTLR